MLFELDSGPGVPITGLLRVPSIGTSMTRVYLRKLKRDIWRALSLFLMLTHFVHAKCVVHLYRRLER